jgi:predicted dithiol-disulfide oxidoreductase (DUF899 family)
MATKKEPGMNLARSKDEWLAARKKLLAKEKELTHLRDALSVERRALPWLRVESGAVFQTYSAYSRGIDALNVAYQYLDLVPKGRDESGEAMNWLRRRDEYDR